MEFKNSRENSPYLYRSGTRVIIRSHFVKVSLWKPLSSTDVNQYRPRSVDRERKKLGTVCEKRRTQGAECSPARCVRKLAVAEFRRKYTGCPRYSLESGRLGAVIVVLFKINNHVISNLSKIISFKFN